MDWRVSESCPQCGATVLMEESDHLLACPYCGVRHAVCFPSEPAYVLGKGKALSGRFLVPYLRVRGSVFACMEHAVISKVVDLSVRAAPIQEAPVSLGVRVQGVPMSFPADGPDIVYLGSSSDIKSVLEKALRAASGDGASRAFYRTLVGDVGSVVYLPLVVEGDRVMDGLSGRQTGVIRDGGEIFNGFPRDDAPRGPILVAAVCPHCGWDLEGEGKSTVLVCKGCRRAWEIGPSGLSEVMCLFGSCRDASAVHLPFWRMGLHVVLPQGADPLCPRGEMVLWSPGFKIRPDVFLQVACRLSGAPGYSPEPEEASGPRTFPVTLGRREALKAAKPILYELTGRKRAVGEALAAMQITPVDFQLWYLPFSTSGYDLRCLCLPVALNKNVLRFGRSL